METQKKRSKNSAKWALMRHNEADNQRQVRPTISEVSSKRIWAGSGKQETKALFETVLSLTHYYIKCFLQTNKPSGGRETPHRIQLKPLLEGGTRNASV